MASFWALIKAVPMLKSMFDQLVELYINEQVSSIETERISKDDQITAQYNAISKAKTNEERAALSITLYTLNSN